VTSPASRPPPITPIDCGLLAFAAQGRESLKEELRIFVRDSIPSAASHLAAVPVTEGPSAKRST